MTRLLLKPALILSLSFFNQEVSLAECENGIYLRQNWLLEPQTRNLEGFKDFYLHSSPLLNGLVTDLKIQKKISLNLKSLKDRYPTTRLQAWLSRSVCQEKPTPNCFHLGRPADGRKLLNELRLLKRLGFDGAHLDIEPVSSNNLHYLETLKQISIEKPESFWISIAAMSLKTKPSYVRRPRQNCVPYEWDRSFFQALLPYCNQMVIMNYDTALPDPKTYAEFTTKQAAEIALLLDRKINFQIGIPTYQTGRPGCFDPKTENFQSAVLGLSQAWKHCPARGGVTVFIEDEFSEINQRKLHTSF